MHLRAAATLTPDILKKIKEYGVINYRNSFFKLGFNSVGFFQATGVEWKKSDLDNAIIFYNAIINDTMDKVIVGNTENLDDMTMAYLVDIMKRHYNGDCVAGKNYLYYTPDGEIFPCQMYYNERKSVVDAVKRYKLSTCSECPVVNVCQSFCAGTALNNNKSENEPIDYLCRVEKAKFECIVQRYGYEVYHLKNDKEKYQRLLYAIKQYASENAVSRRFGEI